MLEPIKETDFGFPEQVNLAKKKAFKYAEEKNIIEEYNNSNVKKNITTPDDLVVTEIYYYDFDCDKENESIVFIETTPEWIFGNRGLCVYININKALIIPWEANPYSDGITVFDFGEFSYFNFQITHGASGISYATYDFRGKILECIADSISYYKNGVFLRNPKYGIMHQPMICNTNGDFVTLGIEIITEDDFKKHLENGEEFLNELKANGFDIKEISTCGYYTYHIKFNNYDLSFVFDESDNLIEVFDYNYTETENIINGIDTHNLNIIMP